MAGLYQEMEEARFLLFWLLTSLPIQTGAVQSYHIAKGTKACYGIWLHIHQSKCSEPLFNLFPVVSIPTLHKTANFRQFRHRHFICWSTVIALKQNQKANTKLFRLKLYSCLSFLCQLGKAIEPQQLNKNKNSDPGRPAAASEGRPQNAFWVCLTQKALPRRTSPALPIGSSMAVQLQTCPG